MNWALWFIFLAGSGRVELSDRLAAWKAEIEKQSGVPVHCARLYVERGAGILDIPEDAPEAVLLASLFQGRPELKMEFLPMQAMNLAYDDGAARHQFVLINMARREEFAGGEEGLIAHEFGHIALQAKGYRLPVYDGGPLACEALHVGSMVQHALIRKELTRRGFDQETVWVRNLDEALPRYENAAAAGAGPDANPCARLAQLSLATDVVAGLSEQRWPNRGRYLTALRKKDPRLVAAAEAIAADFTQGAMSTPEQYEVMLDRVRQRVEALFAASETDVVR